MPAIDPPVVPRTPKIWASTDRNWKATTDRAMDRPMVGSHPYFPNICIVAVCAESTAPSTRVAMKLSSVRARSWSNQARPHCLGRPGMTQRQAKKTPVRRSNSEPRKAAREVNARTSNRIANSRATTTEGISTMMRPTGVSPSTQSFDAPPILPSTSSSM